jgi:hypothetical protein
MLHRFKSRNGGRVTAKKSRTKRSAKATAQQADRAYAEFEKLTRGIKPLKRELYVDPSDANVEQPSR